MGRKKGNKTCRVCGFPSTNRNVCEACKIEQPYQQSGEGGIPFKRRRKGE